MSLAGDGRDCQTVVLSVTVHQQLEVARLFSVSLASFYVIKSNARQGLHLHGDMAAAMGTG